MRAAARLAAKTFPHPSPLPEGEGTNRSILHDNMIDVLHVPAFHDNYIWLIRAGNRVAVVDPGDAEPVMQALQRHALQPAAVLCTHHHADHVGGAAALASRWGIPVYGPAQEPIPAVDRPVDEGDTVDLPELGLSFSVLFTPGHTRGHIAYYGHGLLFCGDTLFAAGCGRLFEGTAAQLHASLSRLAALPGDTRLYCGHEYTAANLRFAQTVEPDNPDVRARAEHVRQRRAQDLPSLPSTIALELRTNPFLRTASPTVQRAAETHAGTALASQTEIFTSLRRWKDGFQG